MAKHRMPTQRDYTSTNTMFHLAGACREGGDGQCDGFTAAGDECNCECHTARGKWASIRTVGEMEAAHAEKNRIRRHLTDRKSPSHRA